MCYYKIKAEKEKIVCVKTTSLYLLYFFYYFGNMPIDKDTARHRALTHRKIKLIKKYGKEKGSAMALKMLKQEQAIAKAKAIKKSKAVKKPAVKKPAVKKPAVKKPVAKVADKKKVNYSVSKNLRESCRKSSKCRVSVPDKKKVKEKAKKKAKKKSIIDRF